MSLLDPLQYISQFESNNSATAQNPTSSASGAYQIISGTWQQYAGPMGLLDQYPTAGSAPLEVQQEVAQAIYNDQGFAPWSSNSNLVNAVNQAGGVQAFTSPTNSQAQQSGTLALTGTGSAATSALSSIFDSVASLFQRGALGLLGLVLIAVAAWAVVRNRDLTGGIQRAAKRAVA